MGKSVYSMVLNDEVVALIDREAFKRGASRSQMINEILAEYVGYSTEERRITELIENLNELLSGANKLKVVRRQQSAIDFLSALNYKYSPRVTYSVDLFSEKNYGELKIALRTTNPDLIAITNEFFNDYIKVERELGVNAVYGVRDGKLVRRLDFSNVSTAKELADAISYYIDILDRLFNAYVYDHPFGRAKTNLAENYRRIYKKIIV